MTLTFIFLQVNLKVYHPISIDMLYVKRQVICGHFVFLVNKKGCVVFDFFCAKLPDEKHPCRAVPSRGSVLPARLCSSRGAFRRARRAFGCGRPKCQMHWRGFSFWFYIFVSIIYENLLYIYLEKFKRKFKIGNPFLNWLNW